MAEIVLSEEQQACADAVCHFDARHRAFEPEKQIFRIDGPAGTGKSTLIKYVVPRLPGLTLFAGYTGKSTLVMRRKGCLDPTTIHRLIYLSRGADGQSAATSLRSKIDTLRQANKKLTEEQFEELADVKSCRQQLQRLAETSGSPLFSLNPDSPLATANRLILDECSMVGKQLATDLLSFGIPLIVQGDPGQLPPVRDEGYFTKGEPDFLLTQIHRQAADSPIIQLATLARNKQPLRIGTYGDCRVVGHNDLIASMALEADQIICGRNKTRYINNARMRALLGHKGPLPCPGEKLICLRNDYEAGMLNGALWRVVSAKTLSKTKVSLTLVPDEGGLPITVRAHSAYFTRYQDAETDHAWAEKLAADEKALAFDLREAQCFTYGYVITCHKSQGSEWDNVLVLDESDQFGAYSSNHLYTAITRAAKKVTIRL